MGKETPEIPYEACNKQGKVFALANRLGNDLKEYATRYMQSEFVMQGKDNDYAYYQIAAPSYSLDLVDDDELHGNQPGVGGVSNDEAYWIGFFYKYFGFALSLRSDKVVERVPFEKMRSLYADFGNLPKEEARDKLLQILKGRSYNEWE
ncbi:MAG: hypothetical protein IJ521_07815 [Schwartzia sp.]|nr:hypothetical protein [Schwartzia sp. (in: firmicutes)]